MSYPTCDDVRKVLPNASIVEEVKIGGQKAVFTAIDPDLGKIVVKIMLSEGSAERLDREIQIVVTNEFANVPRILGRGFVEIDQKNALYVLEEFIDGADLRGYISEHKALPVDEVLRLLNSLLETVEQLETCGVVHRDIKPENIMRDSAGKYWLLDFGIARDLDKTSLTATAAHFGPHTAGYAAPEQFRNLKKKIDSKADLFSIGVVAYESLTGDHPFVAGAKSYLEVLKRTELMAVGSIEIDGDTSGELASFIKVLMDKYASRRPPSAKAAKSWFDEILNRYF